MSASLLVLVGVSGSACAHGEPAVIPSQHNQHRGDEPVPSERSDGRGSGAVPSETREHAPVVVRSQDACPVVLDRNASLELRLGGNPSTGFSWGITNGAVGVLTSRGQPSQEGETGVPGSPAEYVYRFDAVAAGAGHLALVYRQPWDTAAAPAATFDCDITVR